MSIKSRQRSEKRPRQNCRSTKQSGPDLRLIAFKPSGLFRSTQKTEGGAFGGVRAEARLISKDTRRKVRAITAKLRQLTVPAV